jgi:integrase
MPAKQQGSTIKRGKVWQARYLDHDGARKGKSGFETKTAANDWLHEKLREVARIKSGEIAPADERPKTVDELLDTFLEKHGRTIDPATARKLKSQLKHARDEFGTRKPDTLRRAELEDWRHALPAGNRHDVFRAFRQALAWAHARGLVEREPTVGITNPKRKTAERREVFPFESWDEVDAVAAELDARYRAIPILAVGTGLRPEEVFGLHRSDIVGKTLHVRRRFSGGMVKLGGKTGHERTVPLRQRVLDALEAMPPRIDTPILFPAPRGGYIDLEKFRHREWAPALRAAGIEHRRVYDCRHTFATWAIRDGVATLTLAKMMGTSVMQLEDTYVRWLKSDADRLRAVFDEADSRADSA